MAEKKDTKKVVDKKDTSKKTNTLNTLKRIFNIGIKTVDSEKTIAPFEIKKGDDGKLRSTPVKFPSDLQLFYDWFLKNCLDNSLSLSQRISRYKDIKFMRFNEGIVSFSIETYSFEASQADVQEQVFSFESSSSKFTKYLYELVYDKWGITQNMVKDWADNLVAYGDCFLINEIDETKGILGFTSIDPMLVKERIEFNASKIQYDYFGLNANKYIRNLTSKDSRMKLLVDKLKTDNDIGKFFKGYLFGFVVDPDFILPPWSMTHMRLFTSESEFYPYGRSLLVNAISPYRQLQASKNLMVMARAAKFPKEHFEVTTDPGMTEMEKWESINEARQEFLNLSRDYNDREANGIGAQIWSSEGLLKYSLIENNMSLDSIADVQLLEESLMRAMGIPFDYITMREGGYTSGIALTKQTKPFHRRIYSIQQAILKELAQNIRLHLEITDEYDLEKETFEVLMNFPNIEDSKERVDAKSSNLNLVKDVVNSLKDILGISTNESLPPDVVTAILKKYSFFEEGDIEEWQKSIEIFKAKNPEAASNNDSKLEMGANSDENKAEMDIEKEKREDEKMQFAKNEDERKENEFQDRERDKREKEKEKSKQVNKTTEMTERLVKKIESLNEDVISEIYFKSRNKRKMFEGVKHNKHFVNSKCVNDEQKMILELVGKKNTVKLEEAEDGSFRDAKNCYRLDEGFISNKDEE
jgi:hypothetical protein